MNITFRQLQVFEAVARLLSFTRAAEALHLSQPAVSMQITQLEGQIGLPLFEQLGKKVFLTEAGRELYHYSRVIAAQLDEAKSVFEALKGISHGHLNIAVASTANYFAARLLAAFAKQHGGVTFSLDVTNRETLLQRLINNDTDLVIMGKPPDELDLEAEAFTDNPLVIIAAPDHLLAGQHAIPLARLQQESFVVREPGSGTRIAMERFFNEQGIHLVTGMEMTSNEAIKQAVEAGLGLGIVSIHTLMLELETRRLVALDVQGLPILRHWYVVYRRGKRLSPAAVAFRQFVLDNAHALLGGDRATPSAGK
ncbi:MAG: LysR family transcriptional regulator [Gammaproteobacteria bacterium]|nr:LysR family transcriptional regulator [Gammaproteobacteria bacterium]